MPLVTTGPISWQSKVRTLIGERRISARALALKMGRSERTVRSWLDGTNRPLEEKTVVAQFAAALDVSAGWLTDGVASAVVARAAAERIPESVIERVPARYRRLAYALADDETADWLLAQLDLYERARRQGRARP